MTIRTSCLVIAVALGCLACGGKESAIPEVSAELKAEAEHVFVNRCARCHGTLGKGDGPEAKALDPRPRNFADPTWQLAVPDAQLDKVIVQGGLAVGKSAVMPAHPELGARPELLVALRQHLRVLAANVNR